MITHSPPFGILDQVTSFGYEIDSKTGERIKLKEVESTGITELKDRVKTIKPKLHVFGHVHEGSGFLFQDDILFVNAAIMDKDHQPGNKPKFCLLYTSPSPRDLSTSRMPSSA